MDKMNMPQDTNGMNCFIIPRGESNAVTEKTTYVTATYTMDWNISSVNFWHGESGCVSPFNNANQSKSGSALQPSPRHKPDSCAALSTQVPTFNPAAKAQ